MEGTPAALGLAGRDSLSVRGVTGRLVAVRTVPSWLGGGTTPDRLSGRYFPARRCQRVAFSIFLCFFLRMRFRRFLISEPMSGRQASSR